MNDDRKLPTNTPMKTSASIRKTLVVAALLSILPCTAITAAGVFPIATDPGNGTNPEGVQQALNLAFDGTNYLVGIQGDGITHNNVTAQLVGPTGALIGSRIQVGRTGGAPGVAFDGTNYLLVWPDDATGPSDHIYGQRISPAGALVGGAFAICTAAGYQELSGIRPVAYGNGKYLVVWDDHRDGVNLAVYGQLVSSSGALVGGNFVISAPVNGQDEYGASVAFDGTRFLVAWQLNSTNSGNHNVTYGTFVTPTGTMGAPFAIGQTVSLDRNPLNLVFDGTNYLVVWNYDSQQDGGGNPIWNIYGRLVTTSGTFPGNEFAIVTTGNPAFPGLAFDGINYLLCWNQNLGAPNSNVGFQFLNASGQPIGPLFTPFAAQGSNPPFCGEVVFDGTRFAVAATLANLDVNFNFTSGDVYGTFIPKSTAPPRLDVAGPRVGAQFPLLLTGTPGINYTIQTSTDLKSTNWTTLVTTPVSAATGTFDITDTGATTTRRFYRAVKP
jgi:hypothetical protein